MELDDLKNTWDDANNRGSKQQNLTREMVEQITQKKYSSKVNKVIYPELIGIVVCLLGATYIALNFYRLDTGLLMTVAAVTIILLLAICVISLVSLQQIHRKPDLNTSCAETLKRFSMQKLRFYKLQKTNVMLCYLLLVGVIVLLSKIVNGIDMSTNKYYWTLSFTIGYIFLMFYSSWVGRHYKTTMEQAETLLEELK